ncbi:MAG TPA: hypothetical protein ENJ80_06665 [Gammaproteobacteria bacterium]|nr:hypothetical protein [Gammaproteobacteria bacterium]
MPVQLINLLLALVISPACLGMDCSLAVVANSSAGTDVLSPQEVRRIYLGAPYSSRDGTLYPLQNNSNPILQEVFLQKILFMSRNAYKRILASRLEQEGFTEPPVYDDQEQLLRRLKTDNRAITYLLESSLPTDGSLKILLSQPCEIM